MFYDPDNETLSKLIVDITSRTFTLVSESGDNKQIPCDSEQFMAVLGVVREMLSIEEVEYV